MEAAALRPGLPAAALRRLREAVAARSRAFWVVAGLTALAALLRFATLGVQSYHHDEIVTASRVLRSSFGHAMDAVGFGESAPPLYYALAWLWTQVTGTGEVGLRSLSALAGAATVPVAFLLAAELRGPRAGLPAAALVAVNPMLLWYSQEARAYALVVLLGAVSLLYCARLLRGGRRADAVGWGIASGLALATHYFALFPVLAEAAFLLRRRWREAVPGMLIVAGFGVLLAPLALRQMSYGHAEWIGNFGLGHRLWETATTFLTGETSDIIGRPERPLLAVVPLALALLGLALLALRGAAAERRAAALPLAVAAATVGLPLAAALTVGKDFVLARNLIPALVPLLVALAIALTAPAARRLGTAVAAALFAYSLAFCLAASLVPSLQRPDWDAVAARVGEPRGARATVTWTLGLAPLRYYLSTGAIQVRAVERYEWRVREVQFVSMGPAPPPSPRLLGPGFREVAVEAVGPLRIRRYRVAGPGLRHLRLRRLPRVELNWRTNATLLDGVGVP